MIVTERFVLRPLTHDQLLKYIRPDFSLESELGLFPYPRTISPELREALDQSVIQKVADPSVNYLFFTLWTIISKENRTMVGDLCLMGEPDENGIVEIGYGTYEDFRKRGVMTEAVKGMIGWLSEQKNCKTLLAHTDKSNTDSISVLLHNNFISDGIEGDLQRWKIDID